MKKRILSMLLALVMVLGMIPDLGLVVHAADTPEVKYGASADAELTEGSLYGARYAKAAYIQLQRDVTYRESLEFTNDVTLDLNGHTLTINGLADGLKVSSGDLTITDSSAAGSGSLISSVDHDNNADYGVYVKNGDIIVEGGSLSGTSDGKNCYGVYAENGSIMVTGGSLSGTARVTGNGSGSTGVYAPAGSITVTGGSLIGQGGSCGVHGGSIAVSGTGSLTGEGSTRGVDVSGSITVSGGSLTGKGDFGVDAYGRITVTGGSLTGTGNYGGVDASGITVTGGSLTGTGTGSSTGVNSYSSITVHGGTLTGTGSYGGVEASVITVTGGSLIGTGMTAVYIGDEDNSSYSIESETTDAAGLKTAVLIKKPAAPVAAVTTADNETTEYTDITSAITAAQGSSDSTLKLLDNVRTDTYVRVESGSFTLDLNGKTWETAADVYIGGDNTHITITDRSIDGDGKLLGNGSGSPTIKLYGSAKLEIMKGTVENNVGKNVIDMSLSGNPSNAQLTVSGGTVRGPENSTAPAIDAFGASVTITGGTIERSAWDIFYATGTIDLSQHSDPTGITIFYGLPDGASDNIQLSDGYALLDADGNAVTTPALYKLYTVGKVYNINIADTTNGTVTANKTAASKGETVTLTVTPDEGYLIGSVKYNDTAITAQNGVYSFTMPAEDVTVTAIFTEVVAYIDAEGNKQTCTDYTTVTSDLTEWSAGWYVVKGSVVINGSVKMNEDDNVHLILCDGADLTVNGSLNDYGYGLPGIDGGNLTIYGQTNGTGALTVNATDNGMDNEGLTVNGGKITVNSGTMSAVGNGIMTTGSITVNGGSLTAQGGGGRGTEPYGDGITAWDGVTVTGGHLKAIGSIYNGNGINADLTITGGTVEATSHPTGQGHGVEGNVTMGGGSLTATSSGEGYDGIYGDVTITDGTLIAAASNQTDIARYDSGNGIRGNVIMDGGTVKATGYFGGNGITGSVTMNGGSLEATGSRYVDTETTFHGALASAPELNGTFAVTTENFDDAAVPYDPAAIDDYKVFKAAPGTAHSVSIPTVTDGTVTANTTEQAAGWKITLTVTPNEGYELESLTVDGTDVTAQVTNGTYSFTMPDEDVTIAGTFTTKRYAITFNNNGADIPVTDVFHAPYGASLTSGTYTPPTPGKTDYQFAGWYLADANDQMTDTPAPDTMPANDLRLIAKWNAMPYDIYIVSDTNGTVTAPQTASMGETVTLTVMPNTGCSLTAISVTGWTELELTKVNDTTYTFVMPDVPVTVAATFEINKHDIIYMVDGVEHERVEDVAYGTAITPIKAPTRTGHTFSGWSTIPATMPDGDVVINGTFTVKSYRIDWMVKGHQADGSTAGYKWTDVNYGEPITAPNMTWTKEGYLFSGWQNVPETMPADDIIIYGEWIKNFGTITWTVDGETYATTTVTYGKPIAPPETDPEKTGYTFTGWQEVPEAMPQTDLTIEAAFTANTYQVNWYANGGYIFLPGNGRTVTNQTFGQVIVPPQYNILRTGYTLSGWNTKADGTGEWLDTNTVMDQASNTAVIYYAQWNANQYTITFDTDGGSEIDPITLDYGTDIAVPENPTRTGYTFDGWDVEIPETMPAGDLTVTAQWKPITFFIVLRETAEAGAATKYVKAQYDAPLDMSRYDFPRDGYVLKSWSSKGDGTGTVNCNAGETIPADQVNFLFRHAQKEDDGYYYFAYLTAQWDGFFLVLRDSTEADAEITYVWVERGDSLDMSAYDVSREGYNLTGWSSKGDGTGVVNCAVNGTIPAEDIEKLYGYAYKETDGYYYFAYLTAQWEPKQFTVSFDATGGSAIEDQIVAYGETVTEPKTPVRVGYRFDGWYTDADCTTAYDFDASVTGDLLLYAKWNKNPLPSGTSTNRPTIEDTTGGETTVSDKNPDKGDKVTIVTDPDEGYEVGKVTVTDSKGNPVKVIDNGDGTYTYVQPAGKVTITVTYVPTSTGFIDVHKGDYYFNAVNWAVAEGITNGITAATFVPDMICTRAQAVTFLWRAAGSPAPESTTMPFEDVSRAAYYYNAVLWAVENGITKGTSATTFSPDEECTRAQIVTFLWRAQGAPAASGTVGFTDVADDAYYAAAVRWAVANGVTNGMTATTFGPDAKCTRAQIVTFLYRALTD